MIHGHANMKFNKNGPHTQHVSCINLYGMIHLKSYPNREQSYVWHDSLETWYRGSIHELWVIKHISGMFYEY